MARRSKNGVSWTRTKNGVSWAIRFRANGERPYLTLGTSEEGWNRRRAEEELANVLADVRRGIWVDPRRRAKPQEPKPEPTFHEFASEWFEANRREWRANTVSDYQWQLSNHLLPFFAEYRLSEITVEEVDRFRAAKVRAGALSATSINKLLTRLAQVLEIAVEYGHIDRNPAKGRRRRLKAEAPRRTYLDRADQIESLLEAAGRMDATGRGPANRRALFATLLFAGLRLGEALALRWRDVDLAAGRLSVGNSKTEAGIRSIDLVAPLREELAGLRAGRADEPGDALLFATSSGQPLNQSNVRNRALAGAIRRADERRAELGLPEMPSGITPHSMRRTFISVLLAIGEEPTYVMEQVGHTDSRVTISVYGKVMNRRDGERERLRRLVLGPASDPADAGSGALHGPARR